MKNKIVFFLFVAFFIQKVFAHNESAEVLKLNGTDFTQSVNKGFRIGVVAPSLTLEESSNENGSKVFYESDMSNVSGLAVGYEYLPIQALGYSTNFSILSIRKVYDSPSRMFKLDGNMAYAVTDILSFKAGINLSNFSDEMGDDFSMDFGMQAAAEVNLTPSISLEFALYQMRQGHDSNTDPIVRRETGSEIGLYVNF